MSYILELGCWQSVFAVPAELVDKHMRLANAAHIKVMLYLLRHAGKPVDTAALSSATGISEGDVEDALTYWQSCGLLARTDDKLVPPEYESDKVASPQPPVPDTASSVSTAPVDINPAQPDISNAAKQPPKRAERVRYSYSECAEYIASSPEIRQMLPVLEGILQKQLNHTEISVFVTLVHWYGLPVACVALLAEYCRSIGKGTIAYIESTGIGWAGEEINTVELASQKISRLRELSSAWHSVRAALDIPERKPSKREESFCDQWVNKYQMNIELIKLAFDRCIDKKGKLSMSYMNGIIENWHNQGIVTVEQAESEAGTTKNDSAAAAKGRYEPTYDKNEIESVMYNEWFSDDSSF